MDALGNVNAFSPEEVAVAGIDDACNVAHEHHAWPTQPVPEQISVDKGPCRGVQLVSCEVGAKTAITSSRQLLPLSAYRWKADIQKELS